jgi:predicted ATP-grasp superfamily ATP-dependent carboligase
VWPTTRLSVARAKAAQASDADEDAAAADGPPEAAANGDADSATGTGLDKDIVLVHGIEPNMRWRAFTSELVQGLAELGVESVILLGALLADAPHTRPVPVSIGASDPKLSANVNAPFSDYKGPTGILGVVQYQLAQAGIPAVSLWASVPHYVAQPPSPKATLALLRGVEDVLDVSLPLGDLPQASGDAIAREFERYLRRRGRRGEPGGL